MTVKAK
ncbi:Protein of unknown function [Propionibacterium freudenreichii]|nr:Protein of unknown function [Propionibacterium freudenreichii]